MSKFRIYPDKQNTIASGEAFKLLNSSKNEVTTLWYGGGVEQSNVYRENSISRHLVHFDLTNLLNKFSTYEINQNFVSGYRLKMKNSIPKDYLLEPEFNKNSLNKKIASSFDLVVFPINKSWDEGRGYDLTEQNYIKRQTGSLVLSGVSNWLSASTMTSWNEPGVFNNPTASTSFYSTQHFETGGEDLDIDITHIVNNWLSGGTNYGLGIGYVRPIELMSSTTRYISSFYTNNVKSSFKPFIEVSYSQIIRDDRNQVVNNRPSKLFLYTFSGNSPVNIFSSSTVSIQNSAGSNIYTDLVPTQLGKGVYYISVWMSGGTKGQKYKDIWSGVSFNPLYDRQNITQTFDIKDNYYTNNSKDVNDYVITTYGIDNNAILHNEEIIRTYVDVRVNYSLNKPFINLVLEYKIVMNELTEIIPWTSVNSSTINGMQKYFFDLDTSWLLSNQTYTISFKVSDLGTNKILSEKIKFRIIEKI